MTEHLDAAGWADLLEWSGSLLPKMMLEIATDPIGERVAFLRELEHELRGRKLDDTAERFATQLRPANRANLRRVAIIGGRR